MTDQDPTARSKLEFLYHQVLGDITDLMTRLEAVQKDVSSATEAGAVAAQAAERIEDATRGIGDTIFKQTVSAGKDVATTLKGEGVAISQAIVQAVTTASQQVDAELQQAALTAKPIILRDWRAALMDATASEAKRRGSLAAASSWVSVAAACMFFMFAGGAFVHEYEASKARITPANLRVYAQPGGGYIAAFSGRFSAQRITCKKTLCVRVTPDR